MNSIRRRLLVALLGALLVAGMAGAAATFLSAREEVGRLLDEELRGGHSVVLLCSSEGDGTFGGCSQLRLGISA